MRHMPPRPLTTKLSRYFPKMMLKHERIQKFQPGGGVLRFFKSSKYFTKGRTDLLREAIGPDCVSRGSMPVFLRKHTANCDCPGGGYLDPLSTLWIRPCQILHWSWSGPAVHPKNWTMFYRLLLRSAVAQLVGS